MLKLGQFIKEKREASGLSQKALGDAIGISDSEIHKIETGARKTPSWENLCKIAKTLNFHPFEILQNAGYITEIDLEPYRSPIEGLDTMTKRELAYVQIFADFIISQRDKNDNTGGSYLCNID